MINEMDYYINKMGSHNFEKVTYPLFSTAIYTTNETTKLRFFDSVGPLQWTDLYIPSMLPDPQAFLIRDIRIHGISTNLHLGVFTLQIGNKLYGHWPVWTMAVRHKHRRLMIPLFIPHRMCFKAIIEWQTPCELGKGLSGLPIQHQPIQVCLFGDWARPIQ